MTKVEILRSYTDTLAATSGNLSPVRGRTTLMMALHISSAPPRICETLPIWGYRVLSHAGSWLDTDHPSPNVDPVCRLITPSVSPPPFRQFTDGTASCNRGRLWNGLRLFFFSPVMTPARHAMQVW